MRVKLVKLFGRACTYTLDNHLHTTSVSFWRRAKEACTNLHTIHRMKTDFHVRGGDLICRDNH